MSTEGKQNPVVRNLSNQLLRPLQEEGSQAAQEAALRVLHHFRDLRAARDEGYAALAFRATEHEPSAIRDACRRMGELLDNLGPRLGAERSARVLEASIATLEARVTGVSTEPSTRRAAPPGPGPPDTAAERTRRLREDDPRRSASWSTIDTAQTSARQATISGAFATIDTQGTRGGVPLIRSWPTSLDTWLTHPPTPLAWTRDEDIAAESSAAPFLIRSAHAAPVVGMELQGRARRWLLWCFEGVLMELHVAPAAGIPDLADLLRDQRALSAERAHQLQEAARGVSKRLFSLAFREPGMDPDLIRQLEDARRNSLLRALLHDHPTHIRSLGLERGQPVDTPPPHSLLQQLRPMLPRMQPDLSTAEMREHMHHRASHYPVFNAPAESALGALGIRGRERLLVGDLLQGEHTLERVLAMSPLSPRPTLALLYQLDELGLLTWMKRKRDELWREHAATTLRKALSDWREADAFTVLGTHWSSYDQAIINSHRNMRERLLVDRALTSGDPQLETLAREVAARLDEARDALRTRMGRERVREEHVDSAKRAAAAQLCADQGKLAEFQTDLDRARDAWRRVLELYPSHGTAPTALARLG